MTTKPEEFRLYLEIDKGQLDKELVEQSQLFFNVAEAFVEAADQRDALKEQLAVVDADLDTCFRREAQVRDEKITEGQVKSLIKTHKDHEEAYDAYANAKNLADKLQALKESFHMRSQMLKHLCELYVADFYEKNSIQGTDKADKAVYMQRRERMAQSRRARTAISDMKGTVNAKE